MLKVRLKRTGKKNAPSYRIVVVDSRSPRNGKAVEEIGWYNPSEDRTRVEYDKERLEYWTGCGAQMTEAVEKLIKGEYEYQPYEGSEKEKEAETEETKPKKSEDQKSEKPSKTD